jgi:hypothetical protein
MLGVKQFEVGKYYQMADGEKCMHIIGAVKTTVYGWALVGEEQ